MATNNAINTSLDDQTGSGKFVGDTDPVLPNNLDVGANIRHDGDTTNYIAFGTQTQEYFTNGTSRMDINNSGVRLSATGARVNLISDDTTMAADSSTTLVTQHAAKTYTDTAIGSGAGGTNGQMQYNSSGAFAGDIITTDGAGNWTGDPSITGSLVVDTLILDGNTLTTPVSNADINVQGNGTGALATTKIQVDNISLDGNTITSTSGSLGLTPLNTQSLVLNASGGGSITSSIIGAGNFNVNLDTGLFVLDSTTGVNAVLDEDNMASDSATALATQQSIKAYVDSEIASAAGGSNTQIQYNSTGSLAGDSGFTTNGSGTVTINGLLNVDNLRFNGNTIQSTDTNGFINIIPDGTGGIFMVSDNVQIGAKLAHYFNSGNYIEYGTNTQDFATNSTSRMDIDNSGIRMGAANARVTTILDEDTMSSNSATALATQQSIKAYVDSKDKVIQVKHFSTTTTDTTTSITDVNTSVVLAFTPISASSRLVIFIGGACSASRTSGSILNRTGYFTLRNETAATDLGTYRFGRLSDATSANASPSYHSAANVYNIASPGTSSNTFRLRFRSNNTGCQIALSGADMPSTMTIYEVLTT